ncbi:hypothetical protein [Benzoatithermus flavus]|uniref:Uncharacterized protein n=1 Tax=Benzoatithermus flavus TaxID=3108223 RepID=A0ABU8XUU8_9PROT
MSFSKILLTILVIVAVWRGLRLYHQLQSRLANTGNRATPAAKPAGRAAAQATDLVECPRCGTFVPNGTFCRSREECRYRRT